MDNKNRFQEKLRKQILRITFGIVFVALAMFYVIAIMYDEFDSNRKLTTSKTLIQEQFLELIERSDTSFDKMTQNEELLHFFNDQGDDSIVYQELYKMNKDSEAKFNLILFDKEEIIFNSFKGVEFDAVSKSYQRLIIRNCDQSEESVVLSYNATIQGSSNEYTVIANKIGDVGYALVYVKDYDLLNAIERKPADHFILLDTHSQVLVASDPQFVSEMNRSVVDLGQKEIKLNNLTYSIQSNEIYPGINLITFVYRDSIIDDNSLIFVMFILALVFGVILDYYSKRLSKNTSNSLNTLIEEMDKIKNGELEQLDINTNDEFEIIAKETNEMLHEIKLLGMRNEQLVDLRRRVEIKQLEAQFNPHFLYNTLETIRYTMLIDQQTASDLIVKLNKILRYSVSNATDKVTLLEDLEYIQNFLEIMKLRFQDRFEYFIEIDEKCNSLVIPKLIVQPLIENSLRHNYKNKKDLSIWLTANIEGDALVIEVEDNGDGMDELELNEIKKVITIDGETNGNHIGLSNVAKRLYLLHGQNSKIEISSRKGIGTKVRITIELRGDE